MKKTIGKMLLLTGLTALFMAFTNGPKLTEGVVDFNIEYNNLSPEMKEAESMLPKKLTTYFKGANLRGELPSSMGMMVTIVNSAKKEFYVLSDMMGQKTAMISKEADMKKQQEEIGLKDVKVVIGSETKTIAGYACKKATMTFKSEGVEEKMECYFTESLPASGHYSIPGGDQIKGFMMEYTVNMQGMQMKMTATGVRKEAVADSMFEIPEGYRVVSAEDLNKED